MAFTCSIFAPLRFAHLSALLLLLQVLEAQAALGGMTTCSTASSVQLLWCLGIAGALSYELWDLLSSPLDNVAKPLQTDQLMRVFEAYCLAVLRNSGPTPCEILMPQLMQAGQQFSGKVLKAGAQGRDKLLQALGNAGLVGAGARPTRVVDGHMMLCDVCVTGANVVRSARIAAFRMLHLGSVCHRPCHRCFCELFDCRVLSTTPFCLMVKGKGAA
jgi:hypothetical protein